MKPVDVVIVGGAVVGSAAAYFLCAQPAFTGSVLVLEQDPTYAHCATARSAASIRHQFSTPENIRMSQFGTAFIREAALHLRVGDAVPDLGFHEGGYLFLATADGRAVLEANHRVQRALGVDVALLAPAALRERFAWLATDDLAGGSLGLSGEGWLDAYALMTALRRKAESLGARYRQARVAQIRRTGRAATAVVLEDGSEIGCGVVINAAGTGAAALARSAGVHLPVESRKRSVFYCTSPARITGCPLVIDPSGAYVRPEGTGWICGIAPPAALDPPCADFEVQHALFEDVLWPALARRVPAFESLRVQRAWAGHYDVHALDHNMVLGAHPDVDRLLFANGFSGHGLQHAAAVGRALSELVCFGAFRSLDLSALGWERVIARRALRESNVV